MDTMLPASSWKIWLVDDLDALNDLGKRLGSLGLSWRMHFGKGLADFEQEEGRGYVEVEVPHASAPAQAKADVVLHSWQPHVRLSPDAKRPALVLTRAEESAQADSSAHREVATLLQALRQSSTICPGPDVGASQPWGESILLVDDEAMVRTLFRRVLQASGYFIIEAVGGPEALFLASEFKLPIDLLVTDLAMPRMTGLELAERLARSHPEARVLILSGYGDSALQGRSPADHASAFLPKPCTAENLLRQVRELLAHPAPTAPAQTPAGA